MMKTVKKKRYLMFLSACFLFVFINSAGGCSSGFFRCFTNYGKQAKFILNYMNNVPVEKEGFTIASEQTNGGTQIMSKVGHFLIRDQEVEIDYETVTISPQSSGQKVIDEDYIIGKSKAAAKIADMWNVYQGKEGQKRGLWLGKIEYIDIYNDNILFVLNGIGNGTDMKVNLNGRIPYTLYLYDVKTDDVFYIGFYDNITTDHPNVALFIHYNNEGGI